MNQIILNVTLTGSLIVGLTVLPACSTQPTLGERMLDQGSGTHELGNQWRAGNEKLVKGEKLIKQGNELIEDAREDMREGEDKIANGNKLISEGKKQMEESERVYKNRFPTRYQQIYQNP